MTLAAASVGMPWMWTLAFGHHEDHTPTHGHEATREAGMAALAKSLGDGSGLPCEKPRHESGGWVDSADHLALRREPGDLLPPGGLLGGNHWVPRGVGLAPGGVPPSPP
jgi:hypothetical protein